MSIPWKRFPPLETGLLLSVAVHAVLFFGLGRSGGGDQGELLWAKPDTIEIDLTRPYRLTADPRLARKSDNPGTGAAPVKVPKPGKTNPGLAQKGNVWELPAKPSQKLVPLGQEGNPLSKSTAPSTGSGTTPGEEGGLGGFGTGGDGEVDWVYLTELPRLLNRDEILKNIRRFYPEEERRAGREGRVVTALHLNKEGRVSGLDIEGSAGAAFDEAARRVMALARFSPAKAGDRAVSVKMRQAVDFRLSD